MRERSGEFLPLVPTEFKRLVDFVRKSVRHDGQEPPTRTPCSAPPRFMVFPLGAANYSYHGTWSSATTSSTSVVRVIGSSASSSSSNSNSLTANASKCYNQSDTVWTKTRPRFSRRYWWLSRSRCDIVDSSPTNRTGPEGLETRSWGAVIYDRVGIFGRMTVGISYGHARTEGLR